MNVMTFSDNEVNSFSKYFDNIFGFISSQTLTLLSYRKTFVNTFHKAS